jgi:hypothetical protein
MSVSACTLLHYTDRDEPNAPKIVNALKGQVDKILVFIDNPEIKFDDPDCIILRSNKPFPVIARNMIGALLDTDYVFFQDSDLCTEPDTIKYMLGYAQSYPQSVLGFEGSRMADTPHPYTQGTTIDRGDKLEPVDMLIRTWLVPRRVVGLAVNLYLNNRGIIPDKYVDDILFCLGNRYAFKEQNYALPIVKGCGVIEIGEKEEGQCATPTHYAVRDQVCRYLMESR